MSVRFYLIVDAVYTTRCMGCPHNNMLKRKGEELHDKIYRIFIEYVPAYCA
jgi:hypothetical protein